MIAVFKEIPVPSRLSTIVEGETLFNDAAALVSFNLILQVYSTGSLTLLQGIQHLLFITLGGCGVGLVLGYLSIPIFNRLDDPIELCWSKLKEILRSAKARTSDALHEAITMAVNAITDDNALSWFEHCGLFFESIR